MIWTDEKVALLRKRWSGGYSCSQIAKELGKGFTRSSVIGKVHRLDIERKQKPRGTDAALTKTIVSASRKSGDSVDVAREGKTGLHIHANVVAKRIEHDPLAKLNGDQKPKITCITDLKENTCRWPIGDPQKEGFGYCGELPAQNQPYCPHHHSIAHESLSTRNKRMERTQTERNSEKRKNWASFA